MNKLPIVPGINRASRSRLYYKARRRASNPHARRLRSHRQDAHHDRLSEHRLRDDGGIDDDDAHAAAGDGVLRQGDSYDDAADDDADAVGGCEDDSDEYADFCVLRHDSASTLACE